ncbi:MAG: hypothetical protein JJT95_09305 [Pararhodobacter sp.]|nr:hypothetical protein [Pararhodobacter sp.]
MHVTDRLSAKERIDLNQGHFVPGLARTADIGRNCHLRNAVGEMQAPIDQAGTDTLALDRMRRG